MSRKTNLISISQCYSSNTARSYIPQGSTEASTPHKIIPKLSNFRVEKTIDRLAKLAKAYNFQSSTEQTVWYLTQSSDLTLEVLNYNTEVIEYLISKINRQADNSEPVSRKQLAMVAETMFLYNAFNENGLSNYDWTRILEGLNENIEQTV